MLKRGSYFYYAMSNGMFYFSFGMFISIISVVLAGKGSSATQISLITSAAALFSLVFQPLAGFFADKIRSPKKVGIVCLAMAIVSGLIFGHTKSFIFLFLMNGFTQGFFNGTVALSDRLALESEYSFGTIRVWGSVMFAIAAQLAGYIYDNISTILNYYIFAGAIGITIIGFIGMIDAVPKTAHEDEKVTAKEVFNALIHNKKYLMFVGILCLFQGSFIAQFTYFPLFIQELGGSTTIVGTTLFLSVLSEIPTILFSDRIFKKFSYRNLMIFAGIIQVIRFVWYATLPSPFLIMIVFFFQGMTIIVMVLTAVRIIFDIVDEKYVNSAYGISAMLARGVAALAFIVAAGRILDTFPGTEGFRIIYLISMIATLISVIFAFRFKED